MGISRYEDFLIGSLCFTIDIFLLGAIFCNEWDFLTVMGFFVILIRVIFDHFFSYAHGIIHNNLQIDLIYSSYLCKWKLTNKARKEEERNSRRDPLKQIEPLTS